MSSDCVLCGKAGAGYPAAFCGQEMDPEAPPDGCGDSADACGDCITDERIAALGDAVARWTAAHTCKFTKAAARKPLVAIGGVWIRSKGGSDSVPGHIEVLVEVAGQWRLLGTEDPRSNISHIWEPAGIERAKADPLTIDCDGVHGG